MTKTKMTPNVRLIDRTINGIVTSPWLWGTAITFAFYAALPFLPIDQQSLERYFTATWVAYAVTGLFFIAMSELLMKAVRIPGERIALSTDLLEGLQLDPNLDGLETAKALGAHLDLVARRSEDTQFVRRVRDAIEFVSGRQTANGLDGHLHYLAQSASSRLQDSYALCRTMTWAIPMLGCLGAVTGITMAVANVSPEQQMTGLAVSFDAAALSLALSVILLFSKVAIERTERRILCDVEDAGAKRLIALFPTTEAAKSPLVVAEAEAAAQLLRRTEGMITWQMEVWQTSLEALRDRWTATLSRQQELFDSAFRQGLTGALSDHSEQLAGVRNEFIKAFEMASARISKQVTESQAAIVEQQDRSALLISETWQAFHADLKAARDGQTLSMTRLTDSLTGAAMGWSDRLEDATRGMNDQLKELRVQGTTLLKLTEQESELVKVEQRLAQNLASVRVVDTLEQTLLNLNAAVNLMTIRVKNKAA